MSGKKYLAEAIGTFSLVLIGCGSAVIAGGEVGYLGISLAFGLTLMMMVYTIGGISGCHINPAVTIAMLVGGKIKGKDAGAYILFQCLGAIIAAGVLLLILTGVPGYSIGQDGLGQNFYGALSPGPIQYSLIACFVAELVLTFLFLFVIFGSISKKAPAGFAGISIGFSLAVIHIISIPITGTSVNPARSLGPAVFVGGETFFQLWLFWLAPILGAIFAALLWKSVFEKKEDVVNI
jgi:aquaporin Z